MDAMEVMVVCDVLADDAVELAYPTPTPTESFDPNGVIGLVELFGLYSDLPSPPELE